MKTLEKFVDNLFDPMDHILGFGWMLLTLFFLDGLNVMLIGSQLKPMLGEDTLNESILSIDFASLKSMSFKSMSLFWSLSGGYLLFSLTVFFLDSLYLGGHLKNYSEGGLRKNLFLSFIVGIFISIMFAVVFTATSLQAFFSEELFESKGFIGIILSTFFGFFYGLFWGSFIGMPFGFAWGLFSGLKEEHKTNKIENSVG